MTYLLEPLSSGSPTTSTELLVPTSLRKKLAVHPRIARIDRPLSAIVLLQCVLTLRLRNTAFRDEALYVWTGHRIIAHLLHGAVLYDHPSTYFSGAPAIYPVVAALLDRVGGLTLVRLFSLLCMLAATTSICSIGRRWFGRSAGTLGALAFAIAGPTELLGNFATFDALALAGVAVATALLARAVADERPRRALAEAVASGLLLGTAVLTKYAALLFIPFSLISVVAGAPRGRRRRAAILSTIAFFAVVSEVLPIALTVGASALQGLSRTTTNRVVLDGESAGDLSVWAAKFIGAWVLLAMFATLINLRNRAILSLVLMMGALAPIIYQINIHEFTSLQKHVDFGLIFGSPLVGSLLTSLSRGRRKLVLAALIWILFILGLQQSNWLYHSWNNTASFERIMAYSFKADPYIHTLGDVYEPLRYEMENSTKYWQWDSTEAISYKGISGLAGYEAGLRDHYWQYVYFDGETKISRALEPKMSSFGYHLTNTIVVGSSYGVSKYLVWQRY